MALVATKKELQKRKEMEEDRAKKHREDQAERDEQKFVRHAVIILHKGEGSPRPTPATT